MIYQWRNEYLNGLSKQIGVSAQTVGEEIERLSRHENITPTDVVTAARDENSPLHRFFDWDDQSAAEKYRLTQARHIISAISVTITESAEPVPAFVRVVYQEEAAPTSLYVPIAKAMSNKESRDYLLNEAMIALRGWRKRYSELSELANVFSLVDTAIATYSEPERVLEET